MTLVYLLLLLHAACAWFVTSHFWRPKRLLSVPVFIGLNTFATFYGFPVLIGWITGYLNTATILISLGLAIGAASASWYFHREASIEWRAVWKTVRRQSWFSWPWWVIIAAEFLVIAWVASITQPRWADAVAYHAPIAAEWAQTDRFTLDLPADNLRESQPSNVGAAECFPNAKALVAYMVMKWTGEAYGTASVQIPFLALFIVSLFGLLRLCNLPDWAACIGVLFSLFSTEIMMNSMDAYADVAYYSGVYASLYVLLLIWRGEFEVRQLPIVGMAFAVGVANKPFGLISGGVLGVVLLLLAWWRLPATDRKTRWRNVGLSLGSVVLICLVTGGPWYIHGIVKYHNPIYPVRVDVHGKTVFPGVLGSDISTTMAEDRLGAKGVKAWWKTLLENYRPAIVSPWDGGYGAHYFVLGLPALFVFLLLVLNGPEWRSMMMMIILFVLLAFANGSALIPRYNLFYLAAAGLAFGWILARSPVLLRIPLLAVFLATGGYNYARVIPSVMVRARPPALVYYFLVSGDHRPAAFDCYPGELRALDYWKEQAAPGNVLAVPGFSFRLWSGRPDCRMIEAPPLAEGGDVDAWLAEVRKRGATMLYTAQDHPYFTAALSRPQDFELVFEGNAIGATTHMMKQPRRRDALFALLPATGGHHANP